MVEIAGGALEIGPMRAGDGDRAWDTSTADSRAWTRRREASLGSRNRGTCAAVARSPAAGLGPSPCGGPDLGEGGGRRAGGVTSMVVTVSRSAPAVAGRPMWLASW
jgi:hypothetical protein